MYVQNVLNKYRYGWKFWQEKGELAEDHFMAEILTEELRNSNPQD